MTWRVARRPMPALLEVIDPTERDTFIAEQHNANQFVFRTDKEADRFGRGQVDAAKALTPKPLQR